MTIEAKVILDSLAPNGARLTTFELTYPRFIHAELMTHRVFSRNAASSRAIPTLKKIARIRQDMAKPSEWGTNQKGMQAGGPLDPEVAAQAERLWEQAGLVCLDIATELDGLKLHKQVANRIIEPWDHITTVLSATKLNNHWKLRMEIDEITGRPMADPTYFELATKWKAAFDASTPGRIGFGGENSPEWHLPYVMVNVPESMEYRYLDYEHDGEGAHDYVVRNGSVPDADYHGLILETFRKLSVARCARVSYMRQGQGDIESNIDIHDRLSKAGHWSPFEHVARPINFRFGWVDQSGSDVQFVCPGCHGLFLKRSVFIPHPSEPGAERHVCQKCALGHVTSGNFVGWHQYRKDFSNEAGGD